MFTLELYLFSCFSSGSVPCVCMCWCFFWVTVVCVCVCVFHAWLPARVCTVHSVPQFNSCGCCYLRGCCCWCMRVPRGTRICLEIPSFPYLRSSGDRKHGGFIAIVIVSMNHTYSIVLYQIACYLFPQICIYATDSHKRVFPVPVHQ